MKKKKNIVMPCILTKSLFWNVSGDRWENNKISLSDIWVRKVHSSNIRDGWPRSQEYRCMKTAGTWGRTLDKVRKFGQPVSFTVFYNINGKKKRHRARMRICVRISLFHILAYLYYANAKYIYTHVPLRRDNFLDIPFVVNNGNKM